MPNWVFSSVVVSGDEVSLNALKEQLNTPITKHFPKPIFSGGEITYEPNTQQYSNPIFAFWNVITPNDLEHYYEGDNWYYWNLNHWGTKWDIAKDDETMYSNTELEDLGDNTIMYRFHTAWSPVPEIFNVLAQEYPKLMFDYEYEEEQGWGGRIVWEDGECVSQTEYDIPSSHQDYTDLGKDCVCYHEDEAEYWFKDCPVDTEKYELTENGWVDKEVVGA